jgi:phosphoribosyl 1,2-cyclic phosphodiesterase
MHIVFWGVRGSLPSPGPGTVKYGGNTLCIELRFKAVGRRIIIDAGSGIRELGNYLLEHELPKGPINTDIFISHTHSDHILGFPFFAPIYIPGTKLRVFGPVTHEHNSLEEVFGGQLSYHYFPVRQEELSSEIEYIDLKEERRDLGDGIIVTTKYLNHPVLCLGYRFEYQGKVLCTAFDTEPFRNLFCKDPDDPSYDEAMALEGDRFAIEENQRMEAFISGADLVVYDAQYTQEEYEAGKVGWGHCSIEYAIAAATRSKVKRLALIHHDPIRTDDELDTLYEKNCNPHGREHPEMFFAREGMKIDL